MKALKLKIAIKSQFRGMINNFMNKLFVKEVPTQAKERLILFLIS